ncbi:MAG: phosphoglycerate dehydrogenase [Candidatus Gastranaerophilales bacterium]|nr:phosphoglycerate dehydrogenase [Candidatus Gastranaerophilales bacterium]
MKVLITDKINESAGKILDGVAEAVFLPTMSEDELCEKIGEYDALMVRSQTKVTAKIIEAGKNLKIIGRAGVGVDNIDIEAATQKGVLVVNSPDGNTNAAAEHTVALMLAMSRNIPTAATSTKAGNWERSKFTGVEVFGKTLGIIGFGKIGSHVAKVAIALGMHVLVSDPYTSEQTVEKAGAKYVQNLDDLWGQCDFITVHVPKTRETTYLINKNTISKMKKGVRIINCARGGIIDENALKEALEAGQVASAAIDVYENEPDMSKCPLCSYDGNVVLTPHLGASTKEAQLNVAIDVAEQIRDVLSGKSAKAAVNIPALKPAVLEPVKDYMKISENIGALAFQLAKGNLKSVSIEVKGSLAELDISPLQIAILKGVFSSITEGVNYVNAPVIAKQKGINVVTSKSQKDCTYIGSITVRLLTDEDEQIVTGALIAEHMPKIVAINEHRMSLDPDEHMLIIPHVNQPGMIAKVATVIGKDNVNISRMYVAKNTNEDGISIMIINTDSKVDAETLKEISEIDGIKDAKYIHLEA